MAGLHQRRRPPASRSSRPQSVLAGGVVFAVRLGGEGEERTTVRSRPVDADGWTEPIVLPGILAPAAGRRPPTADGGGVVAAGYRADGRVLLAALDLSTGALTGAAGDVIPRLRPRHGLAGRAGGARGGVSRGR
ncbi:hypothetical protein ACFVUH_35075 [Kitasatospora sp. NPDC058032]|uniref:hypothetical protein n=1 Tax=Kitasatospora sp. NPDC058032 TaxID=3346307 RepID=UPI0036DB13FF